MSKLMVLPNTTDELRGKLNFVTSEIKEIYSIYLTLLSIPTNSNLGGTFLLDCISPLNKTF